MYNQFTELEQKPLPMKKTILNPLDIPRAGKKKKPKVHSKNPYRIKKVRILG